MELIGRFHFRFVTNHSFALTIGTFVLGMSFVQSAAATATYSLENGLIKLSSEYYEVALNASNGGIAYIQDKSTSKNIVEGDASSNLWSAKLDNGSPILSSSYMEVSPVWDSDKSTLTLAYTGTINVAVTVTAADGQSLKLQASVTNKTGANISNFELPDSLKISEVYVDNALMPMMPGAQLSSQFFKEGRTYINEYPGVMFADYLAVNSSLGKIALYTQKSAILQPSLIGFEHLKDEASFTKLSHTYRTWIGDMKTWISPSVVISLGQDYVTTIQNYRVDNQIDQFKSLTDKLGDAAPTYFASPMYKLDMAVLKVKFGDIQDAIINKLNIPGIIHFVAYQLGGHDHNYPDLMPPDKKWGTTEDFAKAVKFIHSRGALVLPYTNFSWWDNDGQTLAKLPANVPLNTVIDIKDSHGLPGFETHGPNSGFVINVQNKFVKDKITQQHEMLLNDVGVDSIFEDQWGSRSAPYDYNQVSLSKYDPSTAYFEGVLEHYRDHSDSNLMTEIGIDVLAEDGVGFMGTNYLWDMLGYRGTTAGVTTYYPMAGMLLRDKVLLYQHDLADETWTKNKDMLRWNLAQGYGLSNAFLDNDLNGLNMDNPWLNLVGVFQKYALANYADQLVSSYDDLGNNVKETNFSTYKVYSNWDTTKSYDVGGNTLLPGGVVSIADDGSVVAGVFTAVNGKLLSDGDHYLVEVRSPEGIKLFQPVGADSPVVLYKDAAWANVTVRAYAYDGTLVGDVSADAKGDEVSFTYTSTIDGKQVGYYQIAPAS